ncbi:MAG: aminodeoxychorismate/anthranilate synthase component II [Spirochaetales bacterium]|nr:aminodeoxychorismate/anthranilate synthase component II [Spirochaetales bacterium]
MKKILLIDNYDSFTYNLLHLIKSNFNGKVIVKRDYQLLNEDYSVYNAIFFSPGPGDPNTTPIIMECLSKCYKTHPIFGVCLGMQCINSFFNGETVKSNYPVHGKSDIVYTKNSSLLYKKIPNNFNVARYHSLKIVPGNDLIITGLTESNIIMSIEHKTLPIFGVQFHPESFLTEYGNEIIKNFIRGVNIE